MTRFADQLRELTWLMANGSWLMHLTRHGRNPNGRRYAIVALFLVLCMLPASWAINHIPLTIPYFRADS
jgi:hypothetical protein